MKDVMIDLEFLGKPPLARIAAIGACEFNIKTGEIGERFYRVVNWANNSDQNLPMDCSTVEWWLTQSAEARAELLKREGRVTLQSALEDFTKFCGNAYVWGNGDDCDCVILEGAYRSIGMLPPWDFWATRDVRTIIDVAERIIGLKPKKMAAREGIEHHALYDAIYQARYTSIAFSMLNPEFGSEL